jgi:FtsH-binding integral membrane protein
MQLLFTVVLTVFFMYYPPVATFVNEHQLMFFISWILAFVTLLVLFWQRKKNPLNLFLLILFTTFMSYGIGTLVSMYDSKVVLQAFLITLGVFLALTAFTFQSKYDFSSWGPFLYAGLWIVIFALVIGWLFPYDKRYHIAISVVCALLFSAYIIYDTYMIIKRVSPEEYILATVDLYLDVINLFVAILAIIGGTSDR